MIALLYVYTKHYKFRIPLRQIRIQLTRGKNGYIVDFPQGKFGYKRGEIWLYSQISPGGKLLYSHFSGGKFYYIAIFPGGWLGGRTTIQHRMTILGQPPVYTSLWWKAFSCSVNHWQRIKSNFLLATIYNNYLLYLIKELSILIIELSNSNREVS